ncbi:MAG: OmpH family outer membrane protein [Prevotellaceae bacterium]|jgi:outer membrane protein|nr:OmpH family outer membrane protein [Prevotellaceae bacterium]
MKKLFVTIIIFCSITVSGFAQKFAMVDMEYIMKNIPSYESTTEQLNLVSRQWRSEIEQKMQEVQKLYKDYQTELIFLSEDQKASREEEIIQKEKETQELKRNYFGPEGELFKKRESLMKPIQDEIFNAIQEISREQNLDLVLDRTSAVSVIYSTPKIDISDAVLKKLGYSN